jgi:pimeloyl-ACP methyl ester carboxylesterase
VPQLRRRGLPGLRRRRGRGGIRGWPLLPAGLGLAAAIAVAGCGGDAHQAATSSPAPRPSTAVASAPSTTATPTVTRTSVGAADWYCLSARERRAMFRLRGPGGDRLAAVSIGTGRVAVVLAHQSNGSLCQWWPYARTLAARFRVVAFDFDGAGASPSGNGNYAGEVAAAAKWAHQHGSRHVVVMGASMGGTAVIVAAAHLGDSVSGVIDLSGPAEFADMNALGAARRVHVPALFAYGTQDLGFAADVRHVRAATAARDKPLLAINTQDHGVDLVNAEWGFAQVRVAVLRFIREVTQG